MCGIVGYVGHRDSVEFLLEGLRRLEYRGYDSSGIASAGSDQNLALTKTVGRIDDLAVRVNGSHAPGPCGIGHTRWATHGAVTEENAHPHIGGQDVLTLVHNGVIENYRALKDRLESHGYQFRSGTDSEVIAHLIASHLACQTSEAQLSPSDGPQRLVMAVKMALAELRGTYGIVVLFRQFPDVLIAARLGSPLVVGVGRGEHFIASDAGALAGYADKIVNLADHQVAIVTADSLQISHRDLGQVQYDVEPLQATNAENGKGSYPHYMLKEICEQPETLENVMRGRLNDDDATAVFGGLNLTPRQLRNVRRIILTACGTSWHAAIVGEYVIEQLARLPVEVEYASELRYRNPPLDRETLVFAITQSGETADTLAAMREMKRKGHRTLAICNVVGSTISHEAEGGIYLRAGQEVGVASTKAFTSQCAVLAMVGLYFGRLNHLGYEDGRKMIDALRELPGQVSVALEVEQRVREVAEKYVGANNFLYLGRQHNFPTALEGALKLKEVSYVHAEGYPAAEMKHGPIALVDQHTPSVFIVPHGFVYEKVLANIEEVKARGGPVIAIVGDDDRQVERLADDVIRVPTVDDVLQPIVSVIPLQLLAYHVAVLRGCDVDKPRNLAKSVTVE